MQFADLHIIWIQINTIFSIIIVLARVWFANYHFVLAHIQQVGFSTRRCENERFFVCNAYQTQTGALFIGILIA